MIDSRHHCDSQPPVAYELWLTAATHLSPVIDGVDRGRVVEQLGHHDVLSIEAGRVQRGVAGGVDRPHVRAQLQQQADDADLTAGGGRVQRGVQLDRGG